MRHLRTAGNERVIDEPIVLAIGAFDGIHLGHQAVIRAAKNVAEELGAYSAVYTFTPHPSVIVGRPKTMILTPEQKKDRIILTGVDFLIEQQFDTDFSQTPADQFLALLRKKFPKICGISVGEDFHFGAGNYGSAYALRQNAVEMTVHIQSFIMMDGQRVSSSAIRESLKAGQIEKANRMLGYSISVAKANMGRLL